MIATEWKEFKEIDWETVYGDMKKPAFVFDGRLLLDADKLREIGFKVCSTSFFSIEGLIGLIGYNYWTIVTRCLMCYSSARPFITDAYLRYGTYYHFRFRISNEEFFGSDNQII